MHPLWGVVTGKDPIQILIFPTFLWLCNTWVEWLTEPHEIVYAGISMFILESRSTGVRELEFSSSIKEVSFVKKTHETDTLDWGLQGLSPKCDVRQ